MIVKIQGRKVNVSNAKCGEQDCFRLGQDKGSFTTGRGYTSYHKTPKWVCMTRHTQGCPTVSVCPACHSALCPGDEECGTCAIERRNKELLKR